ncbi:MAG: 2Fe-2S iron-sulfur cluster-binding protein [Rhizobiaceae bacterium]
MSDDSKHLEVSVWRSDVARYESYSVPIQDSQTVLDVVSWIQQNASPDLSYRYACRVGMCGSCAMMVNGEPRWTCRTHVNKVLKNNKMEIAPLRNLPVVKDLVTDMDPFFDKWVEAKSVFQSTKTRHDEMEPILPDSPKRLAASDAIECINCAVCYAACDVVAANPDYLGPAALNRAWSLVNDVRDGGYEARMEAISGGGGCHNCHSQSSCAQYCPNELNPTASIAGLKRETAKGWLR